MQLTEEVSDRHPTKCPPASVTVDKASGKPSTRTRKTLDTILLVEDEPELRAMLVEALENAGYKVFASEDSESALALLEKMGDVPFVLLSDVLLRGINGHELAEEVLRLRPTTKIGFMSGWFDETLMRHGMCADCAALLRKPFALSDLVSFIEEITGPGLCERLSRVP